MSKAKMALARFRRLFRPSDEATAAVRPGVRADDRWGGAPPYRTLRARLALASSVAVLGVLVSAVVLAGGSAAPADAATGACPNEAIRIEQGEAALALPDCRAYEMVSPFGSIPAGGRGFASVDGNRFLYNTFYPYPETENEGLFYVADRGEHGWSVDIPIPPQDGAKTSLDFACTPSLYPSADLSRVLLADGWHESEQAFCLGDTPALDPGESRGYANLFIGEPDGANYSLVSRLPAGAEPSNAILVDATPDLAEVVYVSATPLTPGVPAEGTYIASDGELHLLTVLPDGTPTGGTLVGADAGPEGLGASPFIHAISDDGEAAFFQSEGKLYLREHPDQDQSAIDPGGCTEPANACTVEIDETEGPGSSGGGIFEWADESGSRVLFRDEEKLTPDATAEAGKPDLYEYDRDKPEGQRLADLTVSNGEAAAVTGVLGASGDLSYVYFSATGDLTGSQENSNGDVAEPGRPNVYLLHEGTLTFIATLAESDLYGPRAGNISPDGRFLVFSSTRTLTSFDNLPPDSEDCGGGPCSEIYLYHAGTGELSCASCAADGERPTAPTPGFADKILLYYSPSPETRARNVDDKGQVFFETPNPLVAADINGAMDVYEFSGGEPHLISSGTASGASEFKDASADGADVFFSTGQQLVRRDGDQGTTIYDARVGGGFPEPPPSPTCEGEACRGTATQAGPGTTPGTSSFNGPGSRGRRHKSDCRSVSTGARQLRLKAKRLRRKAARSGGPAGRRYRRQGARLTRRAKRAAKTARACRRANSRNGK